MSRSDFFRKVASEKHAIDVDGRQLTMTRWEAFLRQIQTLELNKNASAARLLDQIRRQFPGMPAEAINRSSYSSEDDARL
jgi:hypothetical protein